MYTHVFVGVCVYMCICVHAKVYFNVRLLYFSVGVLFSIFACVTVNAVQLCTSPRGCACVCLCVKVSDTVT